jgi:hypothetical protein
MKTTIFDHNITIGYIQADSFPDGIMPAYEALHRKIPFSPDRKFLSVSRPEGNGDISYKAGAEMLDSDEPAQFGLPTLTLKKGEYLTITVENFMDDIPAIGKAFEELMQSPDIDPQGYCVEWYFNETDVHCMIRMAD